MTAEKMGMDKPPYRVVELFSGVGSQRMAFDKGKYYLSKKRVNNIVLHTERERERKRIPIHPHTAQRSGTHYNNIPGQVHHNLCDRGGQ